MKSYYILYHVPLYGLVQKIFAIEHQMIIVRLYHYSKSTQVILCQGQDLKWAPNLAEAAAAGGGLMVQPPWAIRSKGQ